MGKVVNILGFVGQALEKLFSSSVPVQKVAMMACDYVGIVIFQ